MVNSDNQVCTWFMLLWKCFDGYRGRHVKISDMYAKKVVKKLKLAINNSLAGNRIRTEENGFHDYGQFTFTSSNHTYICLKRVRDFKRAILQFDPKMSKKNLIAMKHESSPHERKSSSKHFNFSTFIISNNWSDPIIHPHRSTSTCTK